MSFTGKRRSVGSGHPFEEAFGYCRATRIDDRILVSGTTATGAGGTVALGDPAGQTEFIIDKIEKAINELGGALAHVVRTRIYVRNIDHWRPVAEIHGQRFRDIRPVNTLIQAPMVGDDHLVEIEAEAMVPHTIKM